MSNPTNPFSWQMPTATDLVTDLPADFEVFGQAVATSLADLLGGTTGQVLKKNTNADMDFVWSADSAGMTNPMTTTGDTIYSSSGSTPARLAIGSTGNVLTVAGGVPTWAAPAGGAPTYAVFQDNKASGAGGTFTAGSFLTRDLQTTVYNGITGCSLASNQITLAAGTYIVNALAPAQGVDQHQTRFYNITDSSTAIIGGNAYVASTSLDTYSAVQGGFTIASSKVFELQHRGTTTRAGAGFGTNNGFGVGEVYSIITIAKVA